MSTRTRPMTSDELLRFDDPSVRVELDRGALITMPLPGGGDALPGVRARVADLFDGGG
ncbi:hypothetical protein [Tautonia marina]|uniref:hypothetical protein n=1 Tax=Tautonia marina TaxID=2653855 RepID=UPI0013759709|nr:hypothetical protein [Tautonia marina]